MLPLKSRRRLPKVPQPRRLRHFQADPDWRGKAQFWFWIWLLAIAIPLAAWCGCFSLMLGGSGNGQPERAALGLYALAGVYVPLTIMAGLLGAFAFLRMLYCMIKK